MLAFHKDWFNKDASVLVGMVMTTNRDERNMASPIICLRTDATDHSAVGLDAETGQKVLNLEEFVEDACANTWLQAKAECKPQELAEWIWSLLLGQPYEDADWDSGDPAGTPPILAPNMRSDNLIDKMNNLGFSLVSCAPAHDSDDDTPDSVH